MRPPRGDAVGHHPFVEFPQIKGAALLRLIVAAQFERGQLAEKIPAVGGIVGATRRFLSRRRYGQMRLAFEEGRGLIVYELKEGRGIGIVNKIRAYQLQDGGADTVEANLQLGLEVDLRDYRIPAEIAKYFGLTQVRLMSNNPEKIAALEAVGIQVKRVSAETDAHETAQGYLRVKKEKMGHLIEGF